MNTNFIRVLAILIIFTLLESCNETLVDENLQEDIELKSANTSKKGYIVILNDSELNNELSKLKGYEKKQATVKSKSQKILKRAGITDGEIEHVYGSALKGFSVKIAPGQLKKLESDLSVKYVEEDQVISLVQPYRGKPKKGGGGGTTSPPQQETPWGIDRVGGVGDGTGKTVWVIDSGIDTDHPDIKVDKNKSRSFVTSGKYSIEDGHGHGTHVAGTIAALNNEEGVVGVAAGATIVSLRVLDRRGSGSFSWTIAALDFLASSDGGDEGDVVNMSLGPSQRYTSATVDAAVLAVADKGLKIAIAAGNEGDDANEYSPARVNHNNVYTVSAMDSKDSFASFSNYGTPVDFCAPGVAVRSCYKGGGYVTWNGTSMAAPHVAGLLLTGWSGTFDGNVSGDPDIINDQLNTSDPIAHR